MFDFMSEGLTELLIKFKIIKEEKYSDVEYIISNAVFNISIILSLIYIGMYFNCLKSIAIISVSFNLVRIYTGGIHARSLGRCFITTITLISISAIASNVLIDYSHITAPLSIGFLLAFILKLLEK